MQHMAPIGIGKREKSLRSNEKYPRALYGINWVKGRNGWKLKKNDNKYVVERSTTFIVFQSIHRLFI